MPSPASVQILIRGVPVDPAIVLADVTIRSGRTRADDGLEASSATVELQTAGLVSVQISDPVQVKVNGAARFTGRVCEITRSAVQDDPSASLYTLIGIGPIARLARLLVAMPIPAQTAAARAGAVLDAAGIPYSVQGGATVQMDSYGKAGDAPSAAEDVIGSLMSDTGCIVQDRGDGGILVQFLDSRLGGSTFAPDPAETHVDLAWEQTDDLVNDAVISYGGNTAAAGSTSSNDPSSITTYDRHSINLSTHLGDASSATRRAQSLVARLAYPAWRLGDVQTWDDAVLGYQVGSLVRVGPLPASAPVASPWTGVLEGWVETYQPSSSGGLIGSWDLSLGDPKHSSELLSWAGVEPQSMRWVDVNTSVRWIDATTNEDLIPA
jgi:hypothetical protein